MSLDAFVFCDCYERGRLRTPPPVGVSIKVESDGGLERQDGDWTLEDDLAWDRWREQLACEHPWGRLLHHRLGNISLIGSLRSELRSQSSRFPILLHKVLFSGSHAGDHLPLDLLPALQRELEGLAGFKCSTRKTRAFLSEFQRQMSELVAASLLVNKPIVF